MKNNRVFVATIGTFLEWAEFSYYAYIASLMATLFFPNLNPHMALVATFSVFALGYIFRPMGSLFFGYIGDKYGRRLALQSSIMLMGVSSVLIGCLPTYQSIGITAPILLWLFRSIQGFAVSGEFNGSAIYLIEHDPKKPCRAGSWTGFASALGMMVGSFMAILIYLPNMPEWAWRVPFLLGAVSCFCALYFRKNLSESPEFVRVKTEKLSNPLSLLFKHYKAPLAKAILLVAAIGIYIYTMNVYYASHLVQYTSLAASDTRLIITIGQGLVVVFIAIIALFADRFDAKQIMALGLQGFFIVAPLAYFVPQTGSFTLIVLAQLGYALCNALVGVPIFKILNDMFPAQIRYSGVSIAWGCSMAIFGGTAPLIDHYLQYLLHTPTAPVLYILFATSIALLVLQSEKSYLVKIIG